jgi:hypothetical protein
MMAKKMCQLLISVQQLEDELKDVLRYQEAVSYPGRECASAAQAMATVSALKQQVTDSMFKRSDQNILSVYSKFAKDQRGICQDEFFVRVKRLGLISQAVRRLMSFSLTWT